MQENGQNGQKAIGNTKRLSVSKRWCFTLNNYTEKEVEDINKVFGQNGQFIYGFEVGESGTPHLQGYIIKEKAFRPSELKLSNRIHWEKCKGSHEDNIKYCSKEGNYIKSDGIKIKKPVKVLNENQLYDWQKDIVNIIKQEPDDRTIHWYYDTIGNIGKSTFTKFLCLKYGAIPVEGKKNDILYCCAEYESDIYVFDFERSMEEYISYGAIEKIKNGCFMCSKYESKPIIRNNPHIIIFANFKPDIKALSLDRWHIVCLNKKEEEHEIDHIDG